jgi:hypothetical protein
MTHPANDETTPPRDHSLEFCVVLWEGLPSSEVLAANARTACGQSGVRLRLLDVNDDGAEVSRRFPESPWPCCYLCRGEKTLASFGGFGATPQQINDWITAVTTTHGSP